MVLLMVLITHTGLQLGSGVNFALMASYLAVSFVGVTAGLTIALEHKLTDKQAKAFRQFSYWGHVLASWPLPSLLTFHIISVYYF
jgi:nitrite reductase (NADH) large subunit